MWLLFYSTVHEGNFGVVSFGEDGYSFAIRER